MRPTRRREVWSRRLAVVTLVSALGGCAGIMDPYPEADALKNYKMAEQPTGTDKLAGRLPAAIDAATAQGQAYTQAARNQSVARNVGALALVGGAATALYLGITSDSGGNRDAITAIGIAGASLLGLDQFFLSKPRQALYFKGAAAIDCSIVSMRPYLMTETTFTELKNNLQTLTAAIGNTDAEAVRARALADQLTAVEPANSAIAHARAELAITAGERAKADGIGKAGAELKSGVETADVTLISHVKHVVSQLSIEIQKTEPDLASIQPALVGLPSLAKSLVPGGYYVLKSGEKLGLQSEDKTPATKNPLLVAALDGAVQRLVAATAEMVKAAAAVEPAVNTYQSLRGVVQSDISNCKAPTAALTFSVTPNVTELPVAPGQSYDFSVQPAVGMPRAGFAGMVPKGSRIEILLLNGIYVVRVTIGAEAAGRATLVLGDGTDPARQSIVLVIEAPAPPAGGSRGTTPAKVDLPAAEVASLASLKLFQVLTLQSELVREGAKTLCVDGIAKSATAAAVREYRLAKALKETETSWDKVTEILKPLTVHTASALFGMGTGTEKVVAAAEKNLTGADIQKLQGKLKDSAGKPILVNGVFDVATRQAILDYQNAAAVPPTGLITHPKILAFLLGEDTACKGA